MFIHVNSAVEPPEGFASVHLYRALQLLDRGFVDGTGLIDSSVAFSPSSFGSCGIVGLDVCPEFAALLSDVAVQDLAWAGAVLKELIQFGKTRQLCADATTVSSPPPPSQTRGELRFMMLPSFQGDNVPPVSDDFFDVIFSASSLPQGCHHQPLHLITMGIAPQTSPIASHGLSSALWMELMNRRFVLTRRISTEGAVFRSEPLLLTEVRPSDVCVWEYFKPHDQAMAMAKAVLRSIAKLVHPNADTEPSFSAYLRSLVSTDATWPLPARIHLVDDDASTNDGSPWFIPGIYQQAPMVQEFAEGLYRWSGQLRLATSQEQLQKAALFPLVLPTIQHLADDASGLKDRLLSLLPIVEPLCKNEGSIADVDAVEGVIDEVLRRLGSAGVARFCRCRLTPGSYTALARGVVPPSTETLIRTFQKPHTEGPGQMLSVGARALSKHIARDETANWWGDPKAYKGTQLVKNQMGESAMRRILQDAVWMNTHMLPHDIVAFEVRQAEGYGVRWMLHPEVVSPDDLTVSGVPPPVAQVAEEPDVPLGAGVAASVVAPGTWQLARCEFRGFLEPPDPEGHEKGWHH